jgi:hypothetical protein
MNKESKIKRKKKKTPEKKKKKKKMCGRAFSVCCIECGVHRVAITITRNILLSLLN